MGDSDGWRTARWWRIATAVLAAGVAATIGFELAHGLPATFAQTRGRLGLALQEVQRFGPREARVTAVVPGLPAHAAGIAPGDRLRPARRFDLWRGTRPGEAIELQVMPADGGPARTVVLTAASGPDPEPVFRWFYVVNALGCAVGLGFGAAIGWRQPQRPASRALALALIAYAANVYPSWSPAGLAQQIEQFVFHMMLVPPWLALLWWSLHHDRETPTIAVLRRAWPWIVALSTPVGVLTLLHGLGQGAPWFLLAASAVSFVCGGAALVALASRWRAASGRARLRAGWLLAAFAPPVASSWLPAVAEQFAWPVTGELFLAMAVAALLGYAALGLAVLRHDALDMGVAITRSVVAALAGVLVVGAFHLMQLAVRGLARLEQPVAAALFGAALAAVAYGGFRLLRPLVERCVDRIFFRAWLDRRAALLAFAATPAADAATLAQDWVRAVDRFAPGGGCAVYEARHGGWHCVASTWLEAPAVPASPSIAMTPHGGDLLLALAPRDEPLGADDAAALAEAALQVGGRYLAARLRELAPMQRP